MHKKASSLFIEQMSPGREIHFDSLSTYAATYHGNRSHIILPKSMISELNEAVIEYQKDDPNAVRIVNFVSPFGSGGHLSLRKYWAGFKILVVRKGTTEKQEERKARGFPKGK